MQAAFFILLVIVIASAAFLWSRSRAESMILEWARRQGFELLRADRTYLWRGPYWLRSSKNQAVYRVIVRTGSGQTMAGWVRCGSWLFGVWSDDVDVKWED